MHILSSSLNIAFQCMLVAQSCLTLCDPVDCPWNSPGKNIGVSCILLLQGIFLTQGLNLDLLHCRQILYCEPPRKPLLFLILNFKMGLKVKVSQSCPTLCDPMDIVHGILQARILEWVVYPFSRGSSQPRGRTQVSPIASRLFTRWATREAQNGPMEHHMCAIYILSSMEVTKTPVFLSRKDKKHIKWKNGREQETCSCTWLVGSQFPCQGLDLGPQ